MPEEVVRAKRFEVVDDDGYVRASMGLDCDGAVRLTLRGPEGGRDVTVAAAGQGAGLGVLDGEGRTLMAFGVDGNGGHGVLLKDAGGTTRCRVRVRPDGGVVCEIRDGNGEVSARV